MRNRRRTIDGSNETHLKARKIMSCANPDQDKRRFRRMGRSSPNLGPLVLHSSGTYRSVSPEVFVLPGNFKPSDVSDGSPRITATFDAGTVLPNGDYGWINVFIRAFGGGGNQSNGSRLIVEGTLEFSPSRVATADEESPVGKATSGKQLPVTTPLVGDLGITIAWDEPISGDPYRLLEATKMVYPLP